VFPAKHHRHPSGNSTSKEAAMTAATPRPTTINIPSAVTPVKVAGGQQQELPDLQPAS